MNKSLTVLQVIPRMRAGGAELGCLQIATALVQSGHRALVASEGGPLVDQLVTAGAEHIVLPLATKNPLVLAQNASKLAGIIRRENVTIIHARSRAPAWSALYAAQRTGIPFVTTYHSEYSEKGWLKNFYNSVMARSDTVIAVSDYMAHLIRTRYRTPEDRIAIIHRAFDASVFDPSKLTPDRLTAVRQLLDADGTKPVLILAGRITPRKAQHHLVSALGLLKQRGAPDLVCVLAGEIEKPAFKTELEALGEREGVAHQLRFPGHVRDVAAAYAISDIALNISEQEGLPRVAIEGQAMGVPLIVSDTGPGREVALTEPDVPAGEASGLRVPYANPEALADAITKMLSWSADERKAMGARGSVQVRRRFTLDQLKTKTLAVYDRVTTGRAAPQRIAANGSKQRLPISCFIIALNEADRIEATIASVRDWVDEIIVIDSGSTDGTTAISKAAGARVIFNTWPGFGQQKRFGEEQCRNDWVLNLDADEVVTPALQRSIENVFDSGKPERSVYGMAVKIVYPGWTKPRVFANDHYCLRLYDRRRVRFANSTLFDSVDPKNEKVGNLNGTVYHHSIRSLDDLARKCDERATYNALNSKQKSPLELAIRTVTEFPASFLKYYIGRGHFTGGRTGLGFARITAYYRWQRILRMRRNSNSSIQVL
ncbi:glycosyltransferase [Hyphomicrobium sp.]|jgi:glycosyltransferase involved in cell wall biosynthesis|uniref:glycosyltransferase n=1 Tax=Hyphomicrobium sp. TaxID=82 RepID=UPI00356A81E0